MSECSFTRPIGEVFTNENGIRLKVVARRSCYDCYYDNGNHDCVGNDILGKCSAVFRIDKISVVFVKEEGGQNE